MPPKQMRRATSCFVLAARASSISAGRGRRSRAVLKSIHTTPDHAHPCTEAFVGPPLQRAETNPQLKYGMGWTNSQCSTWRYFEREYDQVGYMLTDCIPVCTLVSPLWQIRHHCEVVTISLVRIALLRRCCGNYMYVQMRCREQQQTREGCGYDISPHRTEASCVPVERDRARARPRRGRGALPRRLIL